MCHLIQRKPGRFILEQCRSCRHVFQNPRLTLAGLDFYYRDFYDGLGRELMAELSGADGQSSHWRQSYCGRIAMVKPFTTPRAWLDVGAADGGSAGSPASHGRMPSSTGWTRA